MTSALKKICTITLTLVWIPIVLALDPLVQTKVGLIKGLRASNGDYSMFMGIPYATVNETNPFGPSIPYPHFDNTFEAFDDSAICPQIEESNNTIFGTLDCLHINIYVPNTASSRNRLPVLVWIHGGAFKRDYHGRYLYGPGYLVRHDVILVTLNYRVGLYGFMCVNTPDVVGNQGLKDQIKALKWINDNIEAFGGDIDKITAYGESAGGNSVGMHLLSPKKKLFNQAMMSSGVPLVRPLVEPNEEAPLKIAEHLGLVTRDINEAVSFLATVDPKLIIAATTAIGHHFWPCVEREYDGVENFLTDQPINFDWPKVKNMNILVGHNYEELLIEHAVGYKNDPAYYDKLDIINSELKRLFDFDENKYKEVEEIVRHFYLGDEEISEKVKWEIINFHSDTQYIHPTHRALGKYLEYEAANIYFYVFSYNGERNLVKKRENITEGGAAHADELGYLFDVSYMTTQPTADDQYIINVITTLWTNFVKFGDPTPELTELVPVKWEPITKDTLKYANIDLPFSIDNRPFTKRMTFWDLFYKSNEKYQKGYKERNEL